MDAVTLSSSAIEKNEETRSSHCLSPMRSSHLPMGRPPSAAVTCSPVSVLGAHCKRSPRRLSSRCSHSLASSATTMAFKASEAPIGEIL